MQYRVSCWSLIIIQKLKVRLQVPSESCYSGRWMPRAIQMWMWTLRCFLHAEMIKETLCWKNVWKSDIKGNNLTFCGCMRWIYHFVGFCCSLCSCHTRKKVGSMHVFMNETLNPTLYRLPSTKNCCCLLSQKDTDIRLIHWIITSWSLYHLIIQSFHLIWQAKNKKTSQY